MKRALPWLPYILLTLTLALCVLVLLEPWRQAARPPDTNAPRNEVLIAYEEPVEEGPLVGQLYKTIITAIKITYVAKINDDQYTEVRAVIDQSEKIRNLSSSRLQSYQEPSALPRLATQVQMVLDSSFFDFSDNGDKRLLPVGTPTPAEIKWIPQPKQAGEAVLRLRFQGVSGLALSVNGAAMHNTGNDDISLPVTVAAMSMPNGIYRLLNVIGPAALALAVAILGVIGVVLAALITRRST